MRSPLRRGFANSQVAILPVVPTALGTARRRRYTVRARSSARSQPGHRAQALAMRGEVRVRGGRHMRRFVRVWALLASCTFPMLAAGADVRDNNGVQIN